MGEEDNVVQLGTELTVLERLVLLSILPKEGNFVTLKLVRKLRENLSFDEAEIKELNFAQDGDQVKWNEKANVTKRVNIGEKMNDLIQEALKKLDDEKKLREDHFSLYEKFVEKKQD